MKTFNKSFLPSKIVYKGVTYKPDNTENSLKINRCHVNDYINRIKSEGRKIIACNVLSKNLKGKTDLYGNLYTPNKWFFVSHK